MSPEKSIPMEQNSPVKGEAQERFDAVPRVLDTFSQRRQFLLALAALVACFSLPLFQLTKFAWHDDLYSYIVLVPFITAYLAWQKTGTVQPSEPRRGAGLALAALGILTLGFYFAACSRGASFHVEDRLAFFTVAFDFLFFSAAVGFLGRQTFKALSFPFAMMVFLVPIPVFARQAIETFLQYGSAFCAQGMLKLTGLPFYRDDLTFHLPGVPFGIAVAPECSGIHSTLILFITSLLAGHLFLKGRWSRAILALAVLPLGLLRNGFRVFTISELCVHYGPKMIDSPIHHKGGPLFFALSLVPFFALLLFLYKREREVRKRVEK